MREFFDQNVTIILFGYGLVFFSLGLAVWLQRRRASRLLLTQALIWLAAFAFVEAVAVWGRAFVPIQERYLDQQIIDGLVVARGIVQVIAFVLLLQFGLRLLVVAPRVRWAATGLSVAIMASAAVGFGLMAQTNGWSFHEWENSLVALSRITVLLPGSVLSAVGLWRQRGELGAAGMLAIQPYAAIASAVFIAYAFLGGIVLDPAPWTNSLLDESDWFAGFGVPLAVARGAAGLVLCVVAVKLLEIFEVEAKQRLDALERSRAVAEERSRFRRDLHDGTIQSIYAAALQLEATAQRCPTDELRDELRGVVHDLNTTIDDVRAYITDLSAIPDTPHEMAARTRELALELSAELSIPVRVRISGQDQSGPLPEGACRHIEQIVREALSNAARHAGPCVVNVSLKFAADEMELMIRDDGRGMAAAEVSQHDGQGLRNMKERARRLSGRMEVQSSSAGTRLLISIPLDSDVPAPVPPHTHPLPEVIPS